MASAKLLLLVAITATFLMTASASVLDSFVAKMLTDNYKTTNSKEIYRFSDDDGSHVGIGAIVNPGTEEEELVVMGSYTVFDWKTNLETITIYTADRNGYKARYTIRQKPIDGSAQFLPPSPVSIHANALKNLAKPIVAEQEGTVKSSVEEEKK